MATKSLPPRLPPRTRVVVGGDGKTYLTGKGRRRYKQSAATRKKRAAALRRFKIPVLSTAAVGIPLFTALGRAGSLNSVAGWANFGREYLSYYTGVYIAEGGGATFSFSRLATGAVPLLAVVIARRFGIFKGVNQQLGRMKIPLRLS